MIDKLETIHSKQKALMLEMKNEKCDDIHSVLRSKQLAESIIELEVKKELLIELISKER